MGIEWFRDLSITILAFVLTVVIILMAIALLRIYRELNSAVLIVKATSKSVHEMVVAIQESIKPTMAIVAAVQGIKAGIERILKRCDKGGGGNE